MPAPLLRLCTAGSVDDGKSTLIGRLLVDSRAVFEDHVSAVAAATRSRPTGAAALDLSLFTDGLKAEREQGITIDVAYRFFSTPRRRFILADTPGHEQYTRNMATGASTADVAVLLADAERGLRPQSFTHARIARLLGVPSFVLAVNKMDRVGFAENAFRAIVDRFEPVLAGTSWRAIPISALHGDNVVEPSSRMRWNDAPPILAHLDAVEVASAADSRLRFPVQLVVRGPGYRALAGRIVSGVARAGARVAVWPGGTSTRIQRIVTMDGDLAEARASQSVALVLEDDVDAGRGDLIADAAPLVSAAFEATVVWMDERPLDPRRLYILKHTTRTSWARIDRPLALNQIEPVTLSTSAPLAADPYAVNRATGSFILIDPDTQFTSGAGLIDRAIAGGRQLSHSTAAAAIARAARDAGSDADAVVAVHRALEGLLR